MIHSESAAASGCMRRSQKKSGAGFAFRIIKITGLVSTPGKGEASGAKVTTASSRNLRVIQSQSLGAETPSQVSAGMMKAKRPSGVKRSRAEERRVGKEGRSRWSPYH